MSKNSVHVRDDKILLTYVDGFESGGQIKFNLSIDAPSANETRGPRQIVKDRFGPLWDNLIMGYDSQMEFALSDSEREAMENKFPMDFPDG